MVSSKTGNKRRMSILTLLLEVPQLVQVGKERRWHENRKRRSITLYLFSDDMIVYMEIPKKSLKTKT